MKEIFRAKHNNNSLTITTALHSTNKSKLIRLNEHSYPTNKEKKKTKRENLNDLSFHESSRDVRY